MAEGLDDIVEHNEYEDDSGSDSANSWDEENGDLDLEDVDANLLDEAYEVDGIFEDEMETNSIFKDGSDDDDDDPIWRQADFENSGMTEPYVSYSRKVERIN